MRVDSDVAFQRDEIILYINLSSNASDELAKKLDKAATFESIREFLIGHSSEKIPFWEGSMATAAIIKAQNEIKETAERSLREGISIEIIGFKSDPVQIMQGTLDFSNTPKYLNNFVPKEHEEFINSLLDIMKGNALVVHINGK